MDLHKGIVVENISSASEAERLFSGLRRPSTSDERWAEINRDCYDAVLGERPNQLLPLAGVGGQLGGAALSAALDLGPYGLIGAVSSGALTIPTLWVVSQNLTVKANSNEQKCVISKQF